ncbi:hypothetical protein EFO70_01075 [Lacticaseibacillus rhamnosus]|nr:hypothetical protein [Lacticaseibacillus rhamnosus]MCT3180140.1 hypothetical protein [Lacticaseibacillus rhamnosus]
MQNDMPILIYRKLLILTLKNWFKSTTTNPFPFSFLVISGYNMAMSHQWYLHIRYCLPAFILR